MIIGAITVLAVVIGVSVIALMIYNYLHQCESFDSAGRFHTRLNANNEYFYMCRDHIYIRDANRTYFPLTDYDAESFDVLPHFYAKDKNNVYYMARVADQLFLTGDEVRKVEGADPRSFEVLSATASRDKNYNYQLFGYHEIRRTPRLR